MIPYSRQEITAEDYDQVFEALHNDIITRGRLVEQFEREVADYAGMKHGISFNSGTTAFYAAIKSLKLDKGFKFLTSPISFCSPCNMGVLCGGRPVFVDVDEQGLIDPEQIRKNIKHNTDLVIPMDYAGHPVDHEQINLAINNRIRFKITDCCHSLGAKWIYKNVDTFGIMNIFSFHPVKTITTGEGGMVVTNYDDIADRLRVIRNNGLVKTERWHYELKSLGMNFHMTEFQAALGLSQLGRIDRVVDHRHEIFTLYNSLLKNEDYISLPVEKDYHVSSHHLYYIRLRHGLDRRMVFDELRSRGIGVMVHYIPVYWFEYYKKRFGFKRGLCPNAERFYNTVLSLPCYVGLSDNRVKNIVKELKEVIEFVQISQHN